MSASGPIGRLGWYGRRLASMSGGEVLHRFGELARKQSARLAKPGWARFDTGDGPLPVLPVDIDLAAADSGLQDRWRAVADDAREHRFSLLGADWSACEDGSIWHFDPVSRRQWPSEAYCFSINYRHSGIYGDVKYVWEVNRLQHLQPMAALARRTGDAQLAGFVANEIESWISDNPPFLGVNWSSGIELSLRAISVLSATRLLGEGAFSAGQRRAIRGFLAASGHWISRYPSRFSSANNHLIAEAAGLLLIAIACPDLPDAGRWTAYARRVLLEEVDRQFHADGIGAEQSPTYTAFTLEFYLLAAKASEAAGNPLPHAVLDRMALAGEALSWFMDENGDVPRIGDDDEGRVIVSDPAADRFYVASVLSATASVCDRPDIAPPVAPPHLRDVIFGRSVGHGRPEGATCFPEGGYSVLRDRVHDKQLVLAMDHAPLGHLSIAAHGHADALAVWLSYGGRPLLADAGTYLYHAGGAWRDAFRGTPLHNTLAIAGESSSLVSGAFNWKAKAVVDGVKVDCDPKAFRCEAAHDGYLGRFGVKHARSLLRIGPDAFTVEDRLEGGNAEARQVSINFLAGEGVEIIATGEAGIFEFVADGKALMRLAGPKDFIGRIAYGDAQDRLGWLSPCFGQKRKAFHLLLEGTALPGRPMITELRLL